MVMPLGVAFGNRRPRRFVSWLAWG